jgi:hypothetical protein
MLIVNFSSIGQIFWTVFKITAFQSADQCTAQLLTPCHRFCRRSSRRRRSRGRRGRSSAGPPPVGLIVPENSAIIHWKMCWKGRRGRSCAGTPPVGLIGPEKSVIIHWKMCWKGRRGRSCAGPPSSRLENAWKISNYPLKKCDEEGEELRRSSFLKALLQYMQRNG